VKAILRAFLWMRWRVLINSLERTGARDTLERFSIAVEKLGPIIALVLLIPSSLALLVLGMTAGFGLANSEWIIAMEVIRYFLLLALALTLIGPVILPTRDSGSVVRLLLLPIPRLSLYIGQMAGSIADPWIILVVPMVLGVAIGLAVGLSFFAAAVALLAGLVLVLFLMGLTALASSIVHLLLRDRRRGEIVMLVLVLIIPVLAMAPQFFFREEARDGRRLTREERAALPPSRMARVATTVAPYVPSEMYRRATIAAATRPAQAVPPLAMLGVLALAVQAAGFAVYRRVLDMPVSLGARRAGAFGGLWNQVIPGLGPAASSVAFTQVRLGLRSPRGRSIIASPLLVALIFAVMTQRAGRAPIPGLDFSSGLGIAAFAVLTSILALMPFSLNQFAIDRAGFTRQMLSPLTVRDLLWGKAVGNGMIAAIPATLGALIPALMLGGGPPLYWVALVLIGIASYVLLAPIAAMLSAFFPKTADLNSIGTSGNAHQAAGLLGMLVFAACAAPGILIAVFAVRFLHRPDLLLPLLLGWLVVASGLSYLLFFPVARFVDSRRETLAQYY
jgi:hypothetical protein